MKLKLMTVASLAALTGSALAANIAGTGTGIIGFNSAIDSTPGTSYVRGDQNIARINDGVYGTDGDFAAIQDTWNGTAGSPEYGYYGVTGLIVPGGEQVVDITADVALASDGGWFGPNSTIPAAGLLTGAELVVPTVQVTSDGGTTWSNIGASVNDYLTNLTGANIGGTGGNPNPFYVTVNFTLDTPQSGIDGIRLIGLAGGGPAGADTNGFVGLSEFEVNSAAIPEPSSLALLGLGLFGLTRRARK